LGGYSLLDEATFDFIQQSGQGYGALREVLGERRVP